MNMPRMPWSEFQYLPSHYQEYLLPESFNEVKFNLWPRHIRGERTVLAVKKDMVISEVLLLLKHKLKLGSGLKVDLFKNCLQIEDDDILQTENGDYDCVFSSSRLLTSISCVPEESKRALRTTSHKDVSIRTPLEEIHQARTKNTNTSSLNIARKDRSKVDRSLLKAPDTF